MRDHGSGGGEAPPGEREGEGEEADNGGPWAIQSPGASPRGAPRRSASLDPDRRHVRLALKTLAPSQALRCWGGALRLNASLWIPTGGMCAWP